MQITRRGALALVGAGACLAMDKPAIEPAVVSRHDASVEQSLRLQITDAASPGYGNVPHLTPDNKDLGIYAAGSASGLIESFTAAYLYPGSRFFGNNLLIHRVKLAADFLERVQHPDGRIDYLDTNFDSTPDTGFTVWGVATAACLAQRYGQRELLALTEPFLRKAGGGLATGGIHTPNHRWVVSSALAQINEVFPDPSYVRRIDQWLAEGIDIDEDGQYTERSTTIYNTICDRAFLVMAVKLKRPELLAPVRQNLKSMLYLLHSDFDVVTEISRRQDQNTRGNMSRYWFPLRYLAVKDGNGQFAAVAHHFAETSASLSTLMEYPEMIGPLPSLLAPPDNYTRVMDKEGIVRFRHGSVSSTLLAKDTTFFTTRSGNNVIGAIRFASAFFGKGQFTAPAIKRQGDRFTLEQQMQAGYYQPLEPARQVNSDNWSQLRRDRKETQICSLTQIVELNQTRTGFQIRMQASGTSGVPLAIEINLREGGKLDGCEAAADVNLLSNGYATYATSDASVRFGPGVCKHRWTQIRGALPRLPGRSVYLTGFTPFDHTLHIDWS